MAKPNIMSGSEALNAFAALKERYTPAQDEIRRLEEKASRGSMSDQEFGRYEALNERYEQYRAIEEQVDLITEFAGTELSDDDRTDLENIAGNTYHSILEFMLQSTWNEPTLRANAILTIQGLRGSQGIDAYVDTVVASYAKFARRRELITPETSLNPNELEYRVTNGKGCGGQHKDKTATCVTIVHTPTGLSASSRERSLHLNKKNALRVLTAR